MQVMIREGVRQYFSDALLLLFLAQRVESRALFFFAQLESSSAKPYGLNTHTHTHTFSAPPSTINNHESGSLFSWWIWYWLYGLFLHLQGADMVGFLRLEGVSWGGWIDSCIDNSLFLSVGGCFIATGGWDADVRREERTWHENLCFVSHWRAMSRLFKVSWRQITHIVGLFL